MIDDDAQQGATARRWVEALTERDPGYVSLVVICELAWVLSRRYRFSREQIAAGLGSLLKVAVLRVEEAELVTEALEQFRASRADFADCYIAVSGRRSGCSHTVTFDLQASKLPGMRLLS